MQAKQIREGARKSGNDFSTLCLFLAVIIKYRARDAVEMEDISKSDQKFYNAHLKPLLTFIVFIYIYYPFTCPSDEIIALWPNRNSR